ncbi:MAG: LPS assembly protein LptD [Phycisphaerales bacterium]|nr:MAG: LPS assembly protein LptD [Phycisphaerales bacterium]
MHTTRHLVWAVALLGCPGWLSAQPLVPLADSVEEPLLPPGISDQDVEMFGELVYLWTEDDGSEVIHVVGEFELHLGRRRIRAREAVIWMTPQAYDGRSYNHFELFLWRSARVVEPAGTTTTSPVLFATLSSSGKVMIWADRRTTESSRGTTLYDEAARVRAQLVARLAPEAEAPSPVTVVDLEGMPGEREPTVRPPVSYRGDNLTIQQMDDRTVVAAIGDVVLSRSDPTGLSTIEIRADAAVIYVAAPAAGEGPDGAPEPDDDAVSPAAILDPSAAPASPLGPVGDVPGAAVPSIGRVQAAYLEGDIVLTYGDRTVRSSRLYYDFENDRALILDPVAFMPAPGRDVPIYVRAEQVRQYSATEWTAYNARLTTSEFYTPHYHIGAAKIEFEDRTPRSVADVVVGPRAGRFKISHSTFNILGVPLLYWPYAQGDLEEDVTALRRIRTGYSGDFGVEVESEWDLFSLLGLARPQGFDAALRLDGYSERGPAAGIDLDYERDSYFGLLRSYYIHDDGKDSLGRSADSEPDTEDRGRATWRHRHYLPSDWELTLEASYVSDDGFLEEYFEREFDFGKEQETVFYLKKQRDNWALTILANAHLLDFVTETEHLPDVTFRLVGQSLGGVATLFSENRAGFVRYRFRDQDLLDFLYFGREDSSGTVARADSRQEVEVPVDVGPVRLVPFGSIRGSAWDDSVDSGSLARVFGTYGVRASMYLWRVYEEVRSDLFDIRGIRHIIKPDVTAWASHTNVDSHEQFLFDEGIEDIDELDGVTIGVRQRWQTKRGDEGRQRTADLVTLDVEMGIFNDAQSFEYTNGFVSYRRPENSISQNYVNTSLIWRVTDSTALLSESNFDLNDGELDVFDLSFAVERRPRLSYVIGYRFIEETQSNLLGVGANYKISEKYTLAARESFDLEQGETEEFTLAIIRKLPRWYVGITFELDEIEDDFGISLSAWPEGFPRAALGTRRFTGLATSTGIRPE